MNHKWLDLDDLDPEGYDRAEIKRLKDEKDRKSLRNKKKREKRERDSGLRRHRPREHSEEGE